MFRKINRQRPINLRKKSIDDTENPIQPNTEDLGSASTTIPEIKPTEDSTISPALDKPRSKKKAVINLSFDDDEGDETPVFKIKRSSASRKLAKSTVKVKELEVEFDGWSEPDRPTSSEIAYDEDTMSLLKRQQEAYNTRAEAAMNLQGIDIHDWNSLSQTTIPEADLIAKARQKRERMRMGIVDIADDDPFLNKSFVALEENTTLGPGSRLVREEDELGDGEEEMNQYLGDRLKLRRGDMKEQLKKMAQEEMKHALEEFDRAEDESDLEYEAMERERLRKVIGDPKVLGRESKSVTNLPKLIPIPSFSQIKNTLQQEINQYQEKIIPYKAAIQAKHQQIATIDAHLKDMSLEHDTLELRIQKYEAIQKIDSKEE